MEVQEIKKKFQVNFYNWSIDSMRKQIIAEYPLMKKHNGFYVLDFLDALLSFEKNEQLEILTSLTHYAHQDALKILNIPFEKKARKIQKKIAERRKEYCRYVLGYHVKLSKYDFTLIPNSFTLLKEAIQSHVEDPSRFIELAQDAWQIEIRLNSWMVINKITFNSESRLLLCSHSIVAYQAENFALYENPIFLFSCFGMPCVSWSIWTEEDIFEAAKSVYGLCSYFFNAAHVILYGLSLKGNSSAFIFSKGAIKTSEYSKEKSKSIKSDFNDRYYQWRLRDAKREVESNFSLVSTVNNFDSLDTLSSLHEFTQEQRLETIVSLIKCSHHKNSNLEQMLTEKEKDIKRSFMESRLKFYKKHLFNIQDKIKKNKLINDKQLKALIREKLKHILGNTFEQDGAELSYHFTYHDWSVNTYISVDVALSYSHVIAFDEFKDSSSMIVCSGAGIDLLRWLSIGSTSWLLIEPDDVPKALNSLALLCSHFLTEAPVLLEDLNL